MHLQVLEESRPNLMIDKWLNLVWVKVTQLWATPPPSKLKHLFFLNPLEQPSSLFPPPPLYLPLLFLSLSSFSPFRLSQKPTSSHQSQLRSISSKTTDFFQSEPIPFRFRIDQVSTKVDDEKKTSSPTEKVKVKQKLTRRSYAKIKNASFGDHQLLPKATEPFSLCLNHLQLHLHRS